MGDLLLVLLQAEIVVEETLKLSPEKLWKYLVFILVAGYIPASYAIKTLWTKLEERNEFIQEKLLAGLQKSKEAMEILYRYKD